MLASLYLTMPQAETILSLWHVREALEVEFGALFKSQRRLSKHWKIAASYPLARPILFSMDLRPTH